MRRVVITGMGIVSPIGNNMADFWTNLSAGVCGVDKITKFDASDFKAGLAAEVQGFDPMEYFSDKSEARRCDLFVQYAMAAAVQAMEDSALEGTVEPERLGTYIGSGVGGIGTMVSEAGKLNDRGPGRVSPFFVPMMIINMASGMVAIRYNARGQSLPVVTACASSAHAIGEAFRAIKHGYADAIIAGGAEASIIPLTVAGFTNMNALSQCTDPKSASVPFDMRRAGFVLGEGAAVLILEEYERAVKRNAKIYAEISGYGNTCDAFHITAPSSTGEGCANAMKAAISESGITCDNIYINAHGTGTQLNDKIETLAIKTALGEKAFTAHISSTKSMTGHTLGAAGAIEAVASVLALKNGIIPPTVGYKEYDPECDLDYTPNKAKQVPIDAAISNSLGFGGQNASLVFEKV